MNCGEGRRVFVLPDPKDSCASPLKREIASKSRRNCFYVTQVGWWRDIFPSDGPNIVLLRHPEKLLSESH